MYLYGISPKPVLQNTVHIIIILAKTKTRKQTRKSKKKNDQKAKI